MTETREAKIRKAIERMPKVELHVHFGGSISDETIERLASENSVDLGHSGKGGAEDRSRYAGLIGFLDSYRLRCKCLQSERDFETACVDVLTRMRRQNIRYAEIIISPTAYRLNGTTTEIIMRGVEAGLKRIHADGGIDARFIFDIGRQFGPEQAWLTVREAVEYQSRGVIALGLGGDELHYAPEIFTEHFAFAKNNGLHRVAHAGEVVGSESVWGALKSLEVERIGHGVGARGNEALLEHLHAYRIPVEMCPTSNVKTGAVRSLANHPLPEFLRRGLMVTLNSDDPAMFGSTLTQEYLLCHGKLGLEWDEIRTLCLNGVRSSFLPDMDKQALLEEFEKELAEIEADLDLS